MTYLLSWAGIDTDVLVGLSDPADADRGRHVVPGRVERDELAPAVVRFTLPSGGDQAVDARRLSSTSAALHVTDAGDGWAVTAFAEGSEAHLRWLIGEAQHGLREVLGDRLVDKPESSRKLAELAATLHALALRAALLSEPIADRANAAA